MPYEYPKGQLELKIQKMELEKHQRKSYKNKCYRIVWEILRYYATFNF